MVVVCDLVTLLAVDDGVSIGTKRFRVKFDAIAVRERERLREITEDASLGENCGFIYRRKNMTVGAWEIILPKQCITSRYF